MTPTTPEPKRDTTDSYVIDEYRRRFLEAVERHPEADAKFRQLEKAARTVSGSVRKRLIEDWAVECHLAAKPVNEWWIIDHVTRWLRRMADEDRPIFHSAAPLGAGGSMANLDEDDLESAAQDQMENEIAASWYSYSSMHRFMSLPRKLSFCLYAFDPMFESLNEYAVEMRASFNAYLEDYLSQQPITGVPQKRELVHYDWLVRYQMLGQKWADIAQSPNHVSAGTVKAEVLELRSIINLPSINKPGRPRKLVGPRLS